MDGAGYDHRGDTVKKRIAVLLAALASLLAAGLPSAWGEGGWVVVADYRMNEGGALRTGGGTLLDWSGHGLNGTIGKHIRFGNLVHTYFAPAPDYDPERIDTVPNYEALQPGDRDVRVTVRFNTTMTGGGHLVSFGQTPHDMIRIQISYSRLFCDWRGDAYDGHLARATLPTAFNDAKWHTLVCVKNAGGVWMSVDGSAWVGSNAHPVGAMRMLTGLSIAGKRNCDGTAGHDCDYYMGYVDDVKVEMR